MKSFRSVGGKHIIIHWQLIRNKDNIQEASTGSESPTPGEATIHTKEFLVSKTASLSIDSFGLTFLG